MSTAAVKSVRTAMPAHLRERLRLLSARAPPQKSENEKSPYVLYWMRAGLALRVRENPALDAAICAANSLQLPLHVFLHVEDDYAYATARRQFFLLQGAKEVASNLSTSGGRLGSKKKENRFVVETAVCRSDKKADLKEKGNSARLAELVRGAAVVVAEEPYCAPFVAGLHKLEKQMLASGADQECWVLDTASVVPCASVAEKDCNRCFAYEKSTWNAHQALMKGAPWSDAELNNSLSFWDEGADKEAGKAAFKLIEEDAAKHCTDAEFEKMNDGDLIMLIDDADKNNAMDGRGKVMKLDRKVRPVASTPGGETAGYARWNAWLAAGNKKGGLAGYAARRNDAMDTAGVSRMSGYINAGMVSPMRLAREAYTTGGAGCEKWLNEFLAWRGMSLGYCYHGWSKHSVTTGVSAEPGLWLLPQWAQKTLKDHAWDQRHKVIDRDTMAAGKTGANKGWDGMQKYLNETGELHNNARMGWGGAIVGWCATPEEGLERLLDLNNTFAYDGHSPPSYGGTLSSMGLFAGQRQDGEVAVYGKVKQPAVKGKYSAMGNGNVIEGAKRALSGVEYASGAAAFFSGGGGSSSSGSGGGNANGVSQSWAPKKKQSGRPSSEDVIDLTQDNGGGNSGNKSKNKRWKQQMKATE